MAGARRPRMRARLQRPPLKRKQRRALHADAQHADPDLLVGTSSCVAPRARAKARAACLRAAFNECAAVGRAAPARCTRAERRAARLAAQLNCQPIPAACSALRRSPRARAARAPQATPLSLALSARNAPKRGCCASAKPRSGTSRSSAPSWSQRGARIAGRRGALAGGNKQANACQKSTPALAALVFRTEQRRACVRAPCCGRLVSYRLDANVGTRRRALRRPLRIGSRASPAGGAPRPCCSRVCAGE